MGRVPFIVIAISVLLIGAGYLIAKSIGTTPFFLADNEERIQVTATPAISTPTVTQSSKTSIEDANAILSKLKPRPDQISAAKKEAPIQLPKRITITSIDVDAGFEYVGMASDNAMDVPKDPMKVAWYKLGPRPGEIGNAIVAGHVDWGGKTAVFWRLSDLNPGDVVEITAADEKSYQFIVQWQRWYDAEKAPVQQLFAQGGVSELTMITCGGVFDQKKRQYMSRLVVRAVRR